MSFNRSPSPADRGLQTSHKELSVMKRGHSIPLRTNPGVDARLEAGSDTHGHEVPGSHEQPPAWSTPPPATTIGTPIHRGTDGLHWSQRGLQNEKDKHHTPIHARSPVIYHTATPSRSPQRPEVRVSPPYADIDGGNPYQFKEALPPTRVGEGYRYPAAKQPNTGYFNAFPYKKNSVQDPVYEWQQRHPQQQQQQQQQPRYHPVEPLLPARQSSPSKRRTKWADPILSHSMYDVNLGGNWVAMPESAEILNVTHNQASNRVVAVSTKAAEWSDVPLGTTVEGYVNPDSHEVELFQNGLLVLRLTPSILKDGRLILTPSTGTVGQSGYWEVLPSSTVAPAPDNVDHVDRIPLSMYDEGYDRDGDRVETVHSGVDAGDGTVINIFT
eukprot:TRINITY_DN3224_c0_g2_i1.p1 TRINITY_DN3224_c0_g2~~TRINITY_DN3224_c0_g2_i1.p1  ORF type:complete len:391 (+),score=70.91 TRINITY_DN3224_c0_g2_i1:23-1174(+)